MSHKVTTVVDKNIIILDEFQLELFENLFKFKNESSFTDIYIYVEGIEFPCHKVILCAASNYFKAMFSCDLKESRLGKVFIENISPWTMKRLLDFIYTGNIEINNENVIDIFNAAVLFQLFKLVDKCTTFIQQHIDLSNCIEINLFASMHNLVKLENDTFQFILENFMQLINFNQKNFTQYPTQMENINSNSIKQELSITSSLSTESSSTVDETYDSQLPFINAYYSDFVKLNEKTFTDLIKSDLLNVSREIYVYYAINKWIEYNSLQINTSSSNKIGQLYESLFKHLRLSALTIEECEFILLNDKYININKVLFYQIKKTLDRKLNLLKESNMINTKTEDLTNRLNKLNINNINDTNSIFDLDTFVNKKLMQQNSDIGNIRNKFRPSTIPREYLCFLSFDKFHVYDFYKSKWDHLSSWPPLINTNNAKSSSIFNAQNSALKQEKNAHKKSRLNGYSTCIINNVLYILGGHLIDDESVSSSSSSLILSSLSSKSASASSSSYSSPSLSPNESISNNLHLENITNELNSDSINLKNISLVDSVYKYDPIKNEWSICSKMLNKRAFHISVCLNTSSNSNVLKTNQSKTQASFKSIKSNYIFLFYGICYENENINSTVSPSIFTINTGSSRITQCFSIDFYNIETDSWSILSINNSLLNHHIYQSFNQYNRNLITQQTDQNNIEINIGSNFNANDSSNIEIINNFLNLQLNQAKSIVSLKNLIYILNQNCIHCYEFNSKLSQLICLPYFQLPINLNSFNLAKAISVKAESQLLSCMSLYSWFSDNEDSNNDDQEINYEHFDDNSENNKALQDDEEENKEHILLKKKRQALIYLISPQQSILYEFYPAKNKLKKLPNLLLKHSENETFIINIKSKLYVTGGVENKKSEVSSFQTINQTIKSDEETNMITENTAIEVYNRQTNSWSIFMNKSENLTHKLALLSANQSISNANKSIPLTKSFFKLKMSLF